MGPQAIHAGDSVEVVGLPRETGGFLVPENGKFPFRKRGPKATQNGDYNSVHVWFSLIFDLRRLGILVTVCFGIHLGVSFAAPKWVAKRMGYQNGKFFPMESQTHVSKRAPREFRNWRVQGNLPTLCQPFANPSPTLCQPFANLSPILCQPFLPTPLQPPLSVDPRHPLRDTG